MKNLKDGEYRVSFLPLDLQECDGELYLFFDYQESRECEREAIKRLQSSDWIIFNADNL